MSVKATRIISFVLLVVLLVAAFLLEGYREQSKNHVLFHNSGVITLK